MNLEIHCVEKFFFHKIDSKNHGLLQSLANLASITMTGIPEFVDKDIVS